MKNQLQLSFLFCTILVSHGLLGQPLKGADSTRNGTRDSLKAATILNYSDYPSIAKNNIIYLDKSGALASRVKINDHVIELLDEFKRPEIFLPWSQVPDVLGKLETANYHALYNGYNKFLKHLKGRVVKQEHPYHPIPNSLDEVVVAIDPGHFAANFTEAIQEEKYVKIRGRDLDQKADVSFYEANLTELTALILQVKLDEYNVKSILTRAPGQNALGKSFDEWYAKDFKKDLEQFKLNGDIKDEDYAKLKKYDTLKALSAKDKRELIFKRFFVPYVEAKKRVDVINDNHPTFTIVIHYNAKENGKRDEEGYLTPVSENYSMAFIPGAFLSNELQRPSEKLDFLRLLLSTDMDKSRRLAHLILEEERKTAGISPAPDQDIKLDEKVCIRTKHDGVYYRNLAMTRPVKGPIVYLEGLLQDNDREAVNLSKKEYKFKHPIYGELTAPVRCEQIAEAILRGFLDWMEENRKYAFAATTDPKSR